MGISRRAALRTLAAAGATAVGVRPAAAAVLPAVPADAVGLLYDATLCIGCKACTAACREANGLAADPGPQTGRVLYHEPVDLTARAKTVIKLVGEANGAAVPGKQYTFVKVQCMHCVDPACASACMLGALQKREFGIVSYDPDLCVGCRYCEVGCPFGVPKLEWTTATPKIVKCELCRERLAAHREPACTDVCPRGAVIFGTRSDLLAEAKRRIREHPDRYVPKVYGETDAGGTQVLYLSHVPFETLGLPALGDTPAPQLARVIQHGVYRGFVAPAALYAALGLVMVRNRRSAEASRSIDEAPRSIGEAPRSSEEDRDAR